MTIQEKEAWLDELERAMRYQLDWVFGEYLGDLPQELDDFNKAKCLRAFMAEAHRQVGLDYPVIEY